MNFAALGPEVIQIAHKAGDAIMEVYGGTADFAVEQKADHTPITLADRIADKIISEGLTALHPQWPVISEESELPPYEERRHWPYCWIVDPLDGTKEFIRRNGDFTVNIALVQGQEAVFGLIYAPVTGECFYAAKGQGAYEIHPEGKRRLHCTPFRKQDAGLRILISRSHLNTETEDFIRRYEAPVLVPKGSALKFGLLARGQADVYPRPGRTGEWDTAAGQVILEEAGGRVLDFQTQKPLRYNKEDTLNPFFIAYGNLQP